MKILAIETSCDETAAAVVEDTAVLSNIIASQIKWHRPYGGVVPDIARRQHRRLLPSVIERALKEAELNSPAEVEAIAVTQGPGLAIALEVGIQTAKELAKRYSKPLIGVNHMEGHLLSFLAHSPNEVPPFSLDEITPFLSFLISGGHTQLVLVRRVGEYEVIGRTIDDALGEAFDKVARMLALTYPGGPEIEKLSHQGQAIYPLPVPLKRKGNLDFSFAGLKTAVLYLIAEHYPEYSLRDISSGRAKLPAKFVADLATSFQKTVEEVVEFKLSQALAKYPQLKGISLGGGVANNRRIRQLVGRLAQERQLPLLLPDDRRLYTDNAAMIGIAAYYTYLRGEVVADFSSFDRAPNLELGTNHSPEV